MQESFDILRLIVLAIGLRLNAFYFSECSTGEILPEQGIDFGPGLSIVQVGLCDEVGGTKKQEQKSQYEVPFHVQRFVFECV